MQPSDYYELDLKINPDLEDVISEYFFSNFECDGVVLYEETYKDLERISTTEGTLRIFLKNTGLDEVKISIDNLKNNFKSNGLSREETGSLEYTFEKKASQDWSQKWKEKWDVTHVTQKIAVVPDWIDYQPKPGEIIIKLEPGSAFGTGTHQTTQLCMKALEKYLKQGDEVADIGTGSGILAVLAIKLGAKYVFGCDNDESVISVAKENARKNEIDTNPKANRITFQYITADKINRKFDFVCANILHFVLAEIMGDLKNITKSGGYISLSGILDDKKQMVLDAIERENLAIIEELHQDQWTSFVVRRV